MTETSPSTAPAPPQGPDVRRVVLTTLVWVVLAAVVGVALGWVWMQLADPPRSFSAELDFEREAGITVWYWAVGFVACLVIGLTVGLRGQRLGVWSLLVVVAASVVAALVCAYAGPHWFAPTRSSEAQWYVTNRLISPRPGDQSPLTMIVWLLGGLVGYVSAVTTWDRTARA